MHDLGRDRRLLVVVPRSTADAGGTRPRSELLGLPRVPPVLERKLFHAAEHRQGQGSCLYCDLAAEAGERQVAREGDSVAFVPWATRSPFECWVMPALHDSRFDRATDQRVDEVARLLAFVVGRFGTVLERPRLNLWLHSAPLHEGERDDFHWHVELHPDLGGLDASWADAAGIAVNPVAPETAALWLRDGTDEGRAS
jgi:UDPglucose--hexose-1-phosphate uridylyltransferase